jgi:transposase InsO family protein
MDKPKRTKYGHKALSEADTQIIETVYRDQGVFAGRDRLYHYIKQKHPEFKGSQRALLDWLKHQESWQLSQRPKQHKSVAPLAITKPGYAQADLAIMTSYKDRGFEAFLVVVDGFTKKIWGRPLRTQSEKTAVAAMTDILNSMPKGKISVIQTDRGSHFKQRFTSLLEERGIKHILAKARTPTSQAFVERIGVQNVKKILFQGMRERGDKKWAEYLPKAIQHLNDLRSFTTGMSPNQLDAASPEKQREVGDKISSKLNKKHGGKSITRILHVGQKVRLKRDLGQLNKGGSKGYWTPQVYTIIKRFKSRHPNILATYQVKAANGFTMVGKYSLSDMLPIPPFLDKDGEVLEDATPQKEIVVEPPPPKPRRSTRSEREYEIEFIHGKSKKRAKGKYQTQYLVRWLGFGAEADTWENKSDLTNAKDAVDEYEAKG